MWFVSPRINVAGLCLKRKTCCLKIRSWILWQAPMYHNL